MGVRSFSGYANGFPQFSQEIAGFVSSFRDYSKKKWEARKVSLCFIQFKLYFLKVFQYHVKEVVKINVKIYLKISVLCVSINLSIMWRKTVIKVLLLTRYLISKYISKNQYTHKCFTEYLFSRIIT